MKNTPHVISILLAFLFLLCGLPSIPAQTCHADSLPSIESELKSRLKRKNRSAGEAEATREDIFAIAKCFYSNGEYEEALSRLIFLEKNFDSTSPSAREAFVRIYTLFGKAYGKQNMYRESIEYYEKALRLCPESPEKEELDTRIDLLYKIAQNYLKTEDYLASAEYSQYALASIKNNGLNEPKLEIEILKHLGDTYRFLNNYEESKKNYERGILISRKQNNIERKKSQGMLYFRMGTMQYQYDRYDDAIRSLKKSIAFYSEIYGSKNMNLANARNSLGNIYYYLKNYNEASALFLSTIPIYVEKRQKDAIANQYSKIGACYTNMGEYGKAGQYLERALSTLEFDSRQLHPFAAYKGKPGDLMIILYFTAKNHQKAYEAGRGRAELYEAARYFALCVRYLEFISNELDEPGSGTYFLDRFYYVIETAIGNCYDLYQETDSLHYVDLAFGYAERSKALLLKEALRKADVEEHLGLPAALLRRERSLAGELAGLENRRYEARQAGDEARSHELTGRIYSVRQAHKLLMDSIETAYPAYAQFRAPAEPLSIEEVRARLLQPGQALVQYFEGEDELFIFTFTSGGCALSRIPRDPSLKKAVEAFRESIYRWALEQEDSLLTPYLQYGQFLYRQLIGPIAAQLPPQLIIVPDGILEYLPFEALLYEAPPAGSAAFADYPYLLRRYRISYAHSARLLYEMRRGEASAPRRQVLAYAPWFERVPGEGESVALRRNGLGRLYGNEEEAAHIRRLLKASVRKREEATRARFLEEAPLYSIIHLATHAKANDEEGEYSFLAFTGADDSLRDARLYAKDLFNLRLPAEMVVLSACETGLGELRRGEGVISLARGFSQAGARSLVTTLWRVSDRESAELMRLFYENLAQGLPKDDALHRAKLSFIGAAPPSRAHPFFWAAFVPTGDMSPIRARRQGQGRWQWGLALLGAGLAGWWLRRRGR